MGKDPIEGADVTEPMISKKDGPDKDKYMRKTTLTILLVILNIFLVVILIVIIVYFDKDKSQRVVIKPSETLCLPCDEISIHPDDDRINFRSFTMRKEKEKEICCADHGHNIDKLMQLYVERKHAIKAAEENTRELQAACNSTVSDFMPRVMARVAGITSTKPNGGAFHTVVWRQPVTNSVTRFARNVTFDPETNEFVIHNNRSGYYYVYAQITMKISSLSQEDSTKSLCFNIFKMSAQQSEKLLENSRTRCQFQGEETMSTSYIGAVFNLNQDDRLKVQVSDPNVIEKSEAKSYFGLHVI